MGYSAEQKNDGIYSKKVRYPIMIKIKRKNPPETKMDKNRDKEINKLREQNDKNQKLKFESKYWGSGSGVKEFLFQSQHGKCCYCERKRDQRELDVEHFRPKARLEGCQEHKGYWWKAYDLDNLLISCKKCNQEYKKDKFPLEDESKRAYNEKDNLTKEKPILINPLTENPEGFIEYDLSQNKPLMIKAIGKNKRGQQTVNPLTGINDQALLEERAKKFYMLRLIVLSQASQQKDISIKDAIEDCKKSSNALAGFARFYFRHCFNSQGGLK